MFCPNDWLIEEGSETERVLLEPREIQDLHFAAVENPLDTAEEVSGEVVRECIESMQVYPGKNSAFFLEARNLSAIPEQVVVRYGLCVKQTNIRLLPTFQKAYENECDMWQESGLKPMSPVVIYHVSKNGKWLFIKSSTCRGWVWAKDIAIEERERLVQLESQPFLRVIGKEITIAGQRYPMGTKLYLNREIFVPGRYVVLLPVRQKEGFLQWHSALLRLEKAVSEGNLAYTRGNILRQAMRLVHTKYQWGDGEGMDCSSFVGTVFQCFGILLPRNSAQLSQCGQVVSQRHPLDFSMAKLGDLVHRKGHVMLYLGKKGKKDYIIHAAAGKIGCVAITSIYAKTSEGDRFCDGFTHLTRVI